MNFESSAETTAAACAVALVHRARYHDNCFGDAACGEVCEDLDTPWKELLSKAEAVCIACDALGIISSNETLDDMDAKSMVALVIPYVVGDLLGNPQCDIADRVAFLRGSLDWHRRFLQRQDALCTLPEGALTALLPGEEKMDPARRREMKIRHLRLQKELTGKLELLPRLLSNPAAELWEEDEARDCMVAWMKESALLSLRSIDTVESEIAILNSKQGTPSGTKPTPPPTGKPFFYTIHDPTRLRQAIKDRVFTPYHNLPTVSLEECAKWEMQQDLSISGADPPDKQPKDGNLRDTASSDSENDDDEEVIKEKRRWDDWKDDNPRGYGNKNRNIG